jgi:uncharacterized membrane protein YccC
MRPFSAVLPAIGECVTEMSLFFAAREALYNQKAGLEAAYGEVVSRHALVSEKQEVVRSLILAEQKIVTQKHKQSAFYLKLLTVVIDLYEQLTIIPSDYQLMRDTFGEDTLRVIRKYIRSISEDLMKLGRSLQTRRKYLPDGKVTEDLETLVRLYENMIADTNQREHQMLKDILENTIAITRDLDKLRKLVLYRKAEVRMDNDGLDYSRFVSVPNYGFAPLKTHLTFSSPIFRFALRLALAMSTAYLLIAWLPLGKYSYWILLTIAIVLRPAFSLTRKRNKARLIGTFAGVICGLLFTIVISTFPVQVTVLCLCLAGFYCFLQIDYYAVSVAFITSIVIIGLYLTTGGHPGFVTERIYDTLIGCAITFLASFVFPAWEAKYLKFHINDMLKANINYMENLLQWANTNSIDTNTYKLSRKRVYMTSAKLTVALKHIGKEPKKVFWEAAQINRLLVLNNLLSASISSFGIPHRKGKPYHFKPDEIVALRRSIILLRRGMLSLSAKTSRLEPPAELDTVAAFKYHPVNDQAETKRIGYILEITQEICKHAQNILNYPVPI